MCQTAALIAVSPSITRNASNARRQRWLMQNLFARVARNAIVGNVPRKCHLSAASIRPAFEIVLSVSFRNGAWPAFTGRGDATAVAYCVPNPCCSRPKFRFANPLGTVHVPSIAYNAPVPNPAFLIDIRKSELPRFRRRCTHSRQCARNSLSKSCQVFWGAKSRRSHLTASGCL
jgi:hypothetical protein